MEHTAPAPTDDGALAESTPRGPNGQLLRNGVILGLITALGPFAIDMYLPTLPGISASLGVGADAVLMSLTAYFVTFALGQMVFGPLSDLFGRKPPLYFGIAVFLVGSVGCALAPDIQTLIAFRVLEGLGGAAGIVIARAIVRDLHSGAEEVKLLSMLMLVFSVSPLLAPLGGSLLTEHASWRAVFWFVSALAVAALVMSALLIPETRPRHLRHDSDVSGIVRACGRLLRDGRFMSLSFVAAFGMAGFFMFLASSSFVFTGHYGLSPRLYSLVFSVNAAAFFIGMQLGGKLTQRYDMQQVMRLASVGYAATMVLLALLLGAGWDSLWLVLSLLFIGFGFLGLILPVASVLTLRDYGDIAGTAASLMGTLQLATGAVMMAAGARFMDGGAGRMAVGIALCAVIACGLAVTTLRQAAPQA